MGGTTQVLTPPPEEGTGLSAIPATRPLHVHIFLPPPIIKALIVPMSQSPSLKPHNNGEYYRSSRKRPTNAPSAPRISNQLLSNFDHESRLKSLVSKATLPLESAAKKANQETEPYHAQNQPQSCCPCFQLGVSHAARSIEQELLPLKDRIAFLELHVNLGHPVNLEQPVNPEQSVNLEQPVNLEHSLRLELYTSLDPSQKLYASLPLYVSLGLPVSPELFARLGPYVSLVQYFSPERFKENGPDLMRNVRGSEQGLQTSHGSELGLQTGKKRKVHVRDEAINLKESELTAKADWVQRKTPGVFPGDHTNSLSNRKSSFEKRPLSTQRVGRVSKTRLFAHSTKRVKSQLLSTHVETPEPISTMGIGNISCSRPQPPVKFVFTYGPGVRNQRNEFFSVVNGGDMDACCCGDIEGSQLLNGTWYLYTRKSATKYFEFSREKLFAVHPGKVWRYASKYGLWDLYYDRL